MIFISAEKSSSYSEKRRQPHQCLVAFNKLINVRSGRSGREIESARAQRTAKHTVFVCKSKRHSQGRSYIAAKVDAKRDLYFRSANGVSVTATEAFAAAPSSSPPSPSSSMTERPLFYIYISLSLNNNYFIFQRLRYFVLGTYKLKLLFGFVVAGLVFCGC